MPPELISYLEKIAENAGIDRTQATLDALMLDYQLSLKLEPERELIADYAEKHQLSMRWELAQVIAQLVRAGLKAEGYSK